MSIRIICVLLLAGFLFSGYESKAAEPEIKFSSTPFVHPGMAQTKQDLDFMKKQVNAGVEPWKSAFNKLKEASSLDFEPEAFTHVSVGPYGKNSVGGKELFASAYAAYDFALLWYITDEQKYAQKSIEILNAWSSTLWDFDGNNAKLNVGLTAYYFLNAAEILRYTNSNWSAESIEKFSELMLNVYYQTVRDFFTEANGNWDASIINAMMCIAVFTDNHEIFDRALDRFYWGPGNSGITKYIYPGGQIQETTRDWGHVQLGIGEFAKAAQVAWAQGFDLYSVANDRLAQGYEYCSKFLLGGEIDCYGEFSVRDTDEFRDIYESIADHYLHEKGTDLTYSNEIIKKKTREKSSSGLLTSLRYYEKNNSDGAKVFSPTTFIPFVGAGALVSEMPKGKVIHVSPFDSLQKVLDATAGKNNVVLLDEGVYELDEALSIPSGITIAGKGKKTVIHLKGNLRGATIINSGNDMKNVVIRNLLIEGASDVETPFDPNDARRRRSYMSAPDRAGILFSADRDHQMQNIRIQNVTVQNFTKNGVSVRGADQLQVENCDFSANGSSVVPGAGFHHNLHLTHITGVVVKNCRLDDSPWGCGLSVTSGKQVEISGCEMSRNKQSGVYFLNSENVSVSGSVAEGNDENGVTMENMPVKPGVWILKDNLLQYNGSVAVQLNGTKGCELIGNQKYNNRSEL